MVVDPTGTVDASRGIQQCIEMAYENGATLGLPVGTYLLHKRLDITQTFTLHTSGVATEQPGCGMVGDPAGVLGAPEANGEIRRVQLLRL